MKNRLLKRIAAAAGSMAVLLTSFSQMQFASLYAEETPAAEITDTADVPADTDEPSPVPDESAVTSVATTEPAAEMTTETIAVQTEAATASSEESALTTTVTEAPEELNAAETYTVRFAAESGFVIYVPGDNGLWQQTFSVTAKAGTDVAFKIDGTPFRTVKVGEKFVPSSGDTYLISDIQENTVVRIANGNYSTAFSISKPDKVTADYAVLSMRTPTAAERLYYARIPYAEGQRISTNDVVEAVRNSTDPRTAGIYSMDSSEPLKLYENGFYYFVFENGDGTYKNGAYTCTVRQIDRTAPTIKADFVSYVQEMNGDEVVYTKFRAEFTAYDNGDNAEQIKTLSGIAEPSEFFLVNDLAIRTHALSNAKITLMDGKEDRYQITAEYKGEYTQDMYLIIRDKAGNEAFADIKTADTTTDNVVMKVSYDTSDMGRSCKVWTEAPQSWQLSYLNGGKTSCFYNKFSIFNEGETYTVIADNGRNEVGRTAGFSVTGLDIHPPEIDIVDEYSGKWRSAGNTLISVRLSEAGSSLFYYRSSEPVTDGNYKFSSYASVADKNSVIDVEAPVESGIWYFYFYGEDKHNNETDVIEYVYMLDAEAPAFGEGSKPVYIEDDKYGFVQLIANTLSFDMFFDEYAYAAFSVSDTGGSDISSYQYTFGNEWKDAVPESSLEGYEQYTHFIKLPADADGNLKIRIADNAGNETVYNFADGEVGTNVLINSQTPDVPETDAVTDDGRPYTDGQWTNKSVRITLSGSAVEYAEGCFINPQRFEYSTDDGIWENMPDTDGSTADTVIGGYVNNVMLIEDEMDSVYRFRAAGYNGRVSDECSAAVRIDKTIPENAEYVINGAMGTLPDGSGSGWYTSISSDDLITITAPEADGGSPVTVWYRLSKDGSIADITKFTGNNHPEFSGDGVYSFEIWTSDAAGNVCSKVSYDTISVDTSAPECELLYIRQEGSELPILSGTDKDGSITASMKYYFSETVNIVTSFGFDISGKNRLQYAFSDSAVLEAAENLLWHDYDSEKGIIAEPDMRFYLYVRATDNAGNETIVCSDGIIIDTAEPEGIENAPEIDIIPEPYHYGSFYNRDLEVSIYAEDPSVTGDEESSVETDVRSGLKLVEYKVYCNGEVTQDGRLSLDKDGWSAGGSVVIDSSRNNSNDIIVEVRAVDMSGNERVTRTASGRIRIDTAPPSVSVSYSDVPSSETGGKSYFNRPRKAVIKITERNFSPEDVKASVTCSNGSAPSVSGWSVSGSGDDTEYTGTVTFSADGDYTFDLAFTDMAGNRCVNVSYGGSAAPKKFTIDQTRPVINVEFHNNDEKNGGYFADKRTTVITVNEHNFSASGVKLTAIRNGRAVLSGSEGLIWENKGDIHRASVTFEDDGVYSFGISCTDLASNESGEVSYGSSVYPNEFTIDKTIETPLILVNGRSCSGGAFSGKAVISFSFGDVNYASHSIKATHTAMGDTRDVTDELIGNVNVSAGSCYVTLDNIPEDEQAYDGIYTISVSMDDLAGHSETTEVTFSVNRYGSVYVFSDYLRSLIDGGGSYVKQLEDDIVITEYNANRLKEGSLSIVITHDGRPVDAACTDIEPVINSRVTTGESGWYQYRYVISKENFTADGVYKIAVSSEDEAGNTPENTNYDDQGISFCIDSTAPEIASVTGLEKSIINNKENLVRYSVFDTMGIKKLQVYIDGAVVYSVTDFSEDANNYSGEFTITESKAAQSVRIVVEDIAGNITDTNSKSFSPHYAFERIVTVSTNVFVRVYANKPLLWGIIGGTALLVSVPFMIAFLRKRKRERTAH